jgi:2-furoyl-CoA dehydrogenase FAD binding subunit
LKPPRFDYVRADDIAEVLALLAEHGGDARIVAGGQTLVPMLSMRLVRPKVIVDIMHLPALRGIAAVGRAIRIGAGVRQAALLGWPSVVDHLPLMAAALPWVGHAQTRSRGTVCGSVAHADPSAEIPLVLLALEGEVELVSKRRRRRLTASAFFTGTMTTERQADELIEAVIVPDKGREHGYAFAEFGRRHGDFAIAACAAVCTKERIRLAVGGVADRPVARDFPLLANDALEDALDAFAWDLDARDDMHATARYRRELVRRMGAATIREAQKCSA